MRKLKGLTKEERKHLNEMGIRNFDAFERNAKKQLEMRKENPNSEPCWTCKNIARNLGLEV